MKHLNDTGLRHLIEKIRSETRQLRAMINASNSGSLIAKSWTEVQSIVREGRAKETFAIGDQLVCNHATLGKILWDVIGFDVDQTASGADYTMTLQAHDLIPGKMFDSGEAIYTASFNIIPGTTCFFTLPEGYRESEGGGQSFSFTVESEIFEGSLFVFSWPKGTQAAEGKIRIHESGYIPGFGMEYAVSPGNAGIELSPLNHPAFGEGNNLWSQSFLRKYLNGETWTPSTKYDVTCEEYFEGFQQGLDSDFLAVLEDMIHSERNTYKNTDYQFSDKFTIPSFKNVNGGDGPCEYDTVTYPYYSVETAGTNAQFRRVKTLNGTPAPYFLRSPASGDYCNVSYVTADGNIQETKAAQGFGIAPICCIG